MTKIAILAAMDTEAEQIINSLENVKTQTIAGYEYHSGIYKDKEIIITICSIGKVSSALSTQIIVDHYDPDYIINTGIAGGLNEDLEILDIVIGESLAYHDFEEEIKLAYYPYVDYYKSDERLVRLVADIAKTEGITTKTGLILTGDQFIQSDEIKEELKDRFDNPLCVEMEGAAISQGAYINDIPSIVIRCISDMADTGGMMTYEEFKQRASDESSSIVLKLIEQI